MKILKTVLTTVMVIHFAMFATSGENIGLTKNYSAAETSEITNIPDTQNAFIMPLATLDKSMDAFPKISLPLDSLKTDIWPGSASAVSFYASTLLLASVLNFSYDWMSYGQKYHNGLTTGLTYSMDHLFANKDLGVHFAYTFLAGGGKNHFEMKLGGVFNIVHFTDKGLTFIPVISLGYRYQPPGHKTFFRIGVSTAGLGIGYGFVVASK